MATGFFKVFFFLTNTCSHFILCICSLSNGSYIGNDIFSKRLINIACKSVLHMKMWSLWILWISMTLLKPICVDPKHSAFICWVFWSTGAWEASEVSLTFPAVLSPAPLSPQNKSWKLEFSLKVAHRNLNPSIIQQVTGSSNGHYLHSFFSL